MPDFSGAQEAAIFARQREDERRESYQVIR